MTKHKIRIKPEKDGITIHINDKENQEEPATPAERQAIQELEQDAAYRGTTPTKEERDQGRFLAGRQDEAEEAFDAGWRD